jgi:hypothetical protein
MRYWWLILLPIVSTADKNRDCEIVCPREVERATGGRFDGKESCLCDVPIDYAAAIGPKFPQITLRKVTATQLEDTRESITYSEED